MMDCLSGCVCNSKRRYIDAVSDKSAKDEREKLVWNARRYIYVPFINIKRECRCSRVTLDVFAKILCTVSNMPEDSALFNLRHKKDASPRCVLLCASDRHYFALENRERQTKVNGMSKRPQLFYFPAIIKHQGLFFVLTWAGMYNERCSVKR